MALPQWVIDRGKTVDAFLATTLDALPGDLASGSAPRRLLTAMRYAALSGGKRMRPVITLAAATSLGGDIAAAMPAAAALELIHAYSLVHDDLPAMDDDAERRGKPTVHVEFGEATAILTGDALLTLAFDILARADWDLAASARLKIVSAIAQCAGAAGMVGGQQRDMDAVDRVPTVAEVRQLHAMKTGALFVAACHCGGIAAGANPEQLEILTSFGRAIGQAFQLTDDALELESGATTSGDLHEDRVSLAVRLGREQALAEAHALIERARGSAAKLPHPAELDQLAELVVTRSY